MCGIAGIYRFDGGTVDPEEIDLLTDAVAHRGPDGRGIWFNPEKNLALGHRRLAILDLTEAGKQPMSYDGRYWITLNGEIYNFIEIRNELITRGHSFSTATDTEVILASYKEWGSGMLSRFNGMWSFALYDDQEKILLLSRDRFGVKPLYYFLDENKLIFSSEVQAIHSLLGARHPLNPDVLSDIARGRFFNHGTRETYLKNVFILPGGYNVISKDRKPAEVEWYRLRRTPVPASLPEQAKVLGGLIEDACRLRLRSDVAVGTCLSGGIDSGSITAVISKDDHNREERSANYTHRSFCAAFEGTPLDESASAEKLARLLGANLDTVPVSAPSRSELEEAMKHCDGPMNALAFYPIWKLYRHIRKQGIIVTLDGQGPDEMLGGYFLLYEALVAAVKRRDLFWLIDIYRTFSSQGESSQWSARKAAQRTLRSFLGNAAAGFRNRILPGRFKSLKRKTIAREPAPGGCLSAVRQETDGLGPFDKSLYLQFFQAPLPGILNQYDRCSMASGVECRMPFMDYRIVEYIFSLPSKSKIGGGFTKRILRESMKGILPDSTRLNRLKIGFNAPIVDWFRGPLREFMIEHMNKKAFLNSPYFDGKRLKTEFEDFLNTPEPQFSEAWKFWPPVHLVWWLDHRGIEV